MMKRHGWLLMLLVSMASSLVTIHAASLAELPVSREKAPPFSPTGEPPSPALLKIEEVFNRKLSEIAAQDLIPSTSKPDTNVTETIQMVAEWATQLPDLDDDEDRLEMLSMKMAIAESALKERRVYKYLLWAEARLEQVADRLERGPCSEDELVRLYLLLGEINVSFVTENMVAREIMSTMAEIYDRLGKSAKLRVRRAAVSQQADPFSRIQNVPLRRTLDEF